MSYTVIITEEIAANVSVTTTNYPITIEYNATNIAAGSTYGNSNVSTLLASFGSNSISTTGNVTAAYFVGDGSQLTGLPGGLYGNADVAAYLASGTNTANIVTSGNVQGAFVKGNGSALSAITGANVTGTVANATYATSAGTATTAGTANVANSVAGANVTGVVAQATQAGTANIASVAYSVNAANVSGTVANAAYATASGTAVTVTGAAQANITSVGTLSSLSVSGNVTTSAAFLGNGAVPTGGDADTYLVKNSATNYDYAWTDRVNAKTIYENVKNISGSTLTKGTPVYQAGVTGNTITVGIARADDPAKLAVGVLDVALADQAEGRMLVLGEIKGVNTASFATGDEIYLGATGGYTNVKPTSSSVAIQFLGVVNRIDASNGSGFITGTLTPDAIKYDSYTQTWTGTAWVPTTELSSDASPALGGDLAGGAYNISTTGNITGGNFLGNGSALSSITGANVTGTVANATYATSAGSASTATSATTAGTVTDAAQANITSLGTLSSLSVTGNITSSGNVSGNYILGNGSLLTGIAASYGDANVATLLSGFGSNTISTTGNVTAGNIVISQANNNIRNINAWNANSSPQQARITIGTGYDGNFGANIDPVAITRGAQLAVINKQTIGNADTNQSVRSMTGSFFADLGGGTLNNTNRRMQALQGQLHIGNGTLGFTTGPVFTAAAATGGSLQTGNISLAGTTVDLGAVTVSHGTAALNTILVGGNSNIGNAVGTVNQLQFLLSNANVTSGIGTLSYFTGTGNTAPTNVYGYYMPGTTNNHGITNSNSWRAATNYYFLMNEDDAAQNRLGSLRRYHEFNGVSGTTSGSLTIDKTAGQVQQVNLTGNVSSVAFSNFVTSASDGTNTDEQCDTVTVVFNQGATGNFGVTFPTGSTYKYAGNVTALQSTAANSVSLVSVSAVRLSGTTTYLITISPGFV